MNYITLIFCLGCNFSGEELLNSVSIKRQVLRDNVFSKPYSISASNAARTVCPFWLGLVIPVASERNRSQQNYGQE